MPTGTNHHNTIREAAVRDYHQSGESIKVVAARHGIPRTTLGQWIKPPPGRKAAQWLSEDLAYEGGWVNRGGVMYPAEPVRRSA